ncbi:MAG: bifunctional phosphoglucose/phosphomannose isomerase [Clostridia bacterium]|nr:bifunctional phosphoglucose/phosphomannose isomerase [Clostridia bacterium]
MALLFMDDLEYIKSLDSQNMLEDLKNMPSQIRDSWLLGQDLRLPACIHQNYWQQVLFIGMGGSAIGGDLISGYARSLASIPIVLNRSYTIPAWVNERTLAIIISYSGNTEETVNAYQLAKKAGAACIAVSSGGELGELAKSYGDSLLELPKGLPPRAAIAYLSIPILVILNRLDILPARRNELPDLLKTLQGLINKVEPEVAFEENPAKKLASSLFNKLPVIWGGTGTTDVVAKRWQCQINENAKSPAITSVLPEANHNEILGRSALSDMRKNWVIVVLRDLGDSIKMQKRFDLSKKIWQDEVGEILEIWSVGASPLARLFYLILLGDYVSIYLALMYGENPAPIDMIEKFKCDLAK